MSSLLIEVAKISIFSSILILAVLIIRVLFRRLNRYLICVLWEIAFLRLIFPFSIPLGFGILPGIQFISDESIFETVQRNETAARAVRNDSGGLLFSYITAIWIIGIALMLLYQAYCALKIRRITKNATRVTDRILTCNHINSPFVIGFFKPEIYIPANNDVNSMGLILAHEQAHIVRFDNFRKSIAWLILTMHWFNPLVWAAYIIFCNDIELACDEKAISGLSQDERKQYAYEILKQSLGVQHPAYSSFFSKSGAKGRIKRIVNHEEVSTGHTILAFALCVLFLFVTISERVDIKGQVLAQATGWFTASYGENYELQNLNTEMIHTFKDKDETRYTVHLTCETMPKFDHADDPMLADDANFGQWEELATEIVVAKPNEKNQPWEVYPAHVA